MSEIEPSERITRFVYSSGHIGKNPPRVKPSAFLPTSKLVTSVNRTSGIEEDEIWKLGADIGKTREQTLHGRADIKAEHISPSGLAVVPDEPPPKHAHILGWSGEDKSADKRAALKLAEKAAAFLAP